MPSHLGVPRRLWLLDVDPHESVIYSPSYSSAVTVFRGIVDLESPWKKLSRLKKTVNAIHSSVLEHYQLKSRGEPVDINSMSM